MNFMEKFNELANRTLVPVANKLGNQRHLAAIRDGMVVAIPLSILGGVCLIISTPPFKPETLPNWGFITDMLNGWYNWAQANKAMLQLPYNMTMALMGLSAVTGEVRGVSLEAGPPPLISQPAFAPSSKRSTVTPVMAFKSWAFPMRSPSISVIEISFKGGNNFIINKSPYTSL